MGTILKSKLSGSSDGELINLATTSSGATVIHTFCTSAEDNTYDEIYLWGYNNGTADINVTLEDGSTTLVLIQSIPAKSGLNLMLPGLIGNTSLALKGFSALTGCGVKGFVNKISS